MNEPLRQTGDFSARLVAEIKSIQWPLIALGMILLFNLIFTEGFFEISVQNGRLVGSLMDLLKRAAPRLIVALGMTPVIATLILMVTGRGMAMLFTGGYVLNYDHPGFVALGVGALIIQTLITTLLTRAVPVQFTLIFQAAVVVIVLMLQSPRIREIAFKHRVRKEARTDG